MKYIRYLSLAVKFISTADRVNVLDVITKAISDKKLTINELIDISKRLCESAGIDFDVTGIKF